MHVILPTAGSRTTGASVSLVRATLPPASWSPGSRSITGRSPNPKNEKETSTMTVIPRLVPPSPVGGW